MIGQDVISKLSELAPIVISIFVSILGLFFVWYLIKRILSADAGTEEMRKIQGLIYKGAMAFLWREYKVIAYFVFIVATIIFFSISRNTAFAFIIGALCSLLAGYIGMDVATKANARTAQAASTSFKTALSVAFRSGAVMGISVVSLGLLGLSAVYLIFILL